MSNKLNHLNEHKNPFAFFAPLPAPFNSAFLFNWGAFNRGSKSIYARFARTSRKAPQFDIRSIHGYCIKYITIH